jgi:L-ascorbate metabolism protein UlaG (beta-lactamase superfamily)
MLRSLQRLFIGSLAFVVLVVLPVSAVSCSWAAPGYRGPPLPHYDGESFRNQVPLQTKSFWTLAKWRMSRDALDWEDRRGLPPGEPPPERVGLGELRVTWVNHATALVQMDGVNILTDPIWSERASPVSWAGPARARDPGIRFEDLPPIDVVLVSHNHYDHFDTPTLARLATDHAPRVLAGLGSRAFLEQESIDGGEDLGWWQTVSFSDRVAVTAVPAQHWSRRGLGDAKNTLWAGFVISGTAGPVYFSGDTGWGPHFEQIHARFGPMRLAMLPIGAFKPRWFMQQMHISPEEAVDAARVLEAQVTVPVHWGTFQLGDDGQDEPVEVLRAYQRVIDDPPTFWVLELGEGRAVPPLASRPLVAQDETDGGQSGTVRP